jgi:hypothetical protein
MPIGDHSERSSPYPAIVLIEVAVLIELPNDMNKNCLEELPDMTRRTLRLRQDHTKR